MTKPTPQYSYGPIAIGAKAAGYLIGVSEEKVREMDRTGHMPQAITLGRRKVWLVSELEAWLASQNAWRAAGAPYAVFWNGPFTPWFMKRFEVHVPVEPASWARPRPPVTWLPLPWVKVPVPPPPTVVLPVVREAPPLRSKLPSPTE